MSNDLSMNTRENIDKEPNNTYDHANYSIFCVLIL